MKSNTEEDFWIKVKKDILTDCWIWQAGKFNDGYGHFKIKNREWRAHRFAYFLIYGEISKNAHICHKCDVKLCVNPNHLFSGSHSDNMNDRLIKNLVKMPKGEKHHNARLKKSDVLYIRSKEGTIEAIKLAKKYKISEKYVRKLWRKGTWRHL